MSFLTGGGDPQIQNQPLGFNAGGLSIGGYGEGEGISPERAADVSGLQTAGQTAADNANTLQQSVGPGFNDLLNARLTDLNNTARSSIGNLSQNLAARRVLGSSFGQDTINRAQLGFQQQRDATIADNFLKSLTANSQLAQQQLQDRQVQFQSGLDELNLEAKISEDINNRANQQMASNAQAQAKLDAGASQGTGSFIGTLLGKAIGNNGINFGSIGTGIMNLGFGGGSPSGFGA